ncbi:MAG: hypothetical protein JOS17DRAFT_773997 [Linnemannia elongata]|nr:MAG: hypothetical protein JOS17DRAFT_773997 [Linnemannia elongata]
MQKDEIISRIALACRAIETLEKKEKIYLDLLQSPSNNHPGETIFNATLGMQSLRHAMFAVRERIVERALEHHNLINSLRTIDEGLAKSNNFVFAHMMLKRMEQLQYEVNEYDAQKGVVLEGNKDHAKKNRELIAKIKCVYDPPEPRPKSRFWRRK